MRVLAVQAADPNLLQPTALSSTTVMPSLQDLSIRFGGMDTQDEWPAALPQGLTRFVMNLRGMTYSDCARNQARIQACLKNLQHMQRLQELKLNICDLDPRLLSHITGLRKLHLLG